MLIVGSEVYQLLADTDCLDINELLWIRVWPLALG